MSFLSRWWWVSGLTFTDPDYSEDVVNTVDIGDDVDGTVVADNVLDRCYIHDVSATGIRIRGETARNTVQRCVIEPARLVSSREAHGIFLANGAKGNIDDTKILNNEIINGPADGLQIHPGSDQPLPLIFFMRNLIIDGNAIYVRPDHYLNATGALDPTGEFACTENAIDFKTGGTEDRPVIVSNNVMYGWRDTPDAGDLSGTPQCSGSSGSAGATIVVHNYAQWIRLRSNVIFDGESGVSMSGERRFEARDNVFYDISNKRFPSYGAVRLRDTRGVDMQLNTFVGTAATHSGDSAWLQFNSGTGTNEVRCNLWVRPGLVADGGDPGVGFEVDHNVFLLRPATHDASYATTSGSDREYRWRVRQDETRYATGDVLVPAGLETGFAYEVASAGTTDAAEPDLSTALGETIADGTVTLRVLLAPLTIAPTPLLDPAARKIIPFARRRDDSDAFPCPIAAGAGTTAGLGTDDEALTRAIAGSAL